jgi:Fe-S oxidoreductase
MTAKRSLMNEIVGDRTVDQQIEDIEKEGWHGQANATRMRILRGLGIYKTREKSDNLIIFGCYIPYHLPFATANYMKLLDRLKIDYTFLEEKEYCCGFPMLMTTDPEDRKKAEEAAHHFMKLDIDLAKQAGAKKMIYLCQLCVYIAREYGPDKDIEHIFYPDLVLEKLKSETLKVDPKTVGYFEGEHLREKTLGPGTDMEWDAYRKTLDSIAGLKVVDIKPLELTQMTTEQIKEQIIDAALKQNLDTIVCTCPSCFVRLKGIARGKINLKYWSDLILEALV